MSNAAGVEIEMIDIGDAAGAVDHPVGYHRPLLAIGAEHGAKLIAGFLDAGDLDAGMHLDADALAFAPDLLDRVLVECAAEGAAELREW